MIRGASAPICPIDDPNLKIDSEKAQTGSQQFNTGCQSCHGYSAVAGGMAPDVRASKLALSLDSFRTLLEEGPLESRGMPKYDDLSEEEIVQLYFYIRQRARVGLNKD